MILAREMKAISVICGANAVPNTGMYSVDLAFHAFCKRHGIDCEVRFYLLEDIPDYLSNDNDLPFTYKCYRNKLSEVFSSDAIVFWGDFNQSLQYYRTSGTDRMLHLGLSKNIDDVFDTFEMYYMFEAAPVEVLRKTAFFGVTIFPTDRVDRRSSRHHLNLANLAENTDCFLVRDVVSAIKMNHITRNYSRNFLGVDCALLLRDADLELLPGSTEIRRKNTGRTAGIFFGRFTDFDPLAKFSLELSDALGMQPEWIPWLDASELPRLLGTAQHGLKARELGLLDQRIRERSRTTMRLRDIFSLISQCDVIITDTYHLCLNGWRMGIPVICIGRGNSQNSRPVHDKKKECFYNMYEAGMFYVFREDIDDEQGKCGTISRLLREIDNPEQIHAVHQNIIDHRDSAERKLLRSLRKRI